MHVSTEARGNRAQTDNHNSLADAADPAESPVLSRRDHPPRRGRRMPGTTAPARTPPRAAAVLAALGTGLGMAMTVLYAGVIADRVDRRLLMIFLQSIMGVLALVLAILTLGGWIAAELAARNTRRLASLTLVCSAGIHVKGVPQVDTFLLSDEQQVRAMYDDQKFADETLKRLQEPGLEDVLLKNRATTAKLIWQPRAYDPHLAKWLHRIDVPTLLLWGANDKLFPKDYAFAFQKLIPGSSVAVIPDCGHIPQVEQRQAFVKALEGFLETKRAAA